MILLIRINLLPATAGKKRRASVGGGQRAVAVIMLALILEFAMLYLYLGTIEEDASAAESAAAQAQKRVKKLEDRKEKLEELQEAKKELARQNVIFEKMKFEKTGPPEMLKFLSYVLTRKEENPYSREELKAQEAAGWASGWDTENLWLIEIVEELGDFTIKGRARSHEDVAEFYRRLETGVYFPIVDPVVQEVVQDDDFKELELVEFEVYTLLNYNPDGQMKMRREEVPEELFAFLPQPKPDPEADKKKGKKGKKGKKAIGKKKGGH